MTPGAIDYWCNLFTPAGIQACFLDAEELRQVFRWWRLEDHLVGYEPAAFLDLLDAAGVEKVLVPAARMRSFRTQRPIWEVPVRDVAELIETAPDRVGGLYGIDPWTRMDGVRELEDAVRRQGFLGAHLHPYGFGLPVNDAAYYPFYARCVELDVPLVVQVGHSAEAMPSAVGRPLLLDDVALYFPELRIVAAHTGWPWVEELVALAWKHPNVFIGTSAHAPKYWDPALVRFLRSRGQGKVLFGTDYPVLRHAAALAQVDALGLGNEARAWLLRETARKVFKI
jgi:predicted TIM-barrel fold metal-dependent hydrolase